jgi:hypothetical protein
MPTGYKAFRAKLNEGVRACVILSTGFGCDFVTAPG